MTTITLDPAHLVDPDMHAEGRVFPLWTWMRKHAPVHRHEAGELPAFWSLTRYEHIRAVYQDPKIFSSAQGVLLRPSRLGEDPGGGLSLALTDPPRHKALRRQVADRFNERCAREMASAMQEEVRSVVRRAIELGSCDLVHDIGARLSTFSICRLLGVAEDDYEQLLDWTTQAFHMGKALAEHEGIMRYIIKLMYDRAEEGVGDAMSMLVHNGVEGELLSETEILLNCENLIGASENAGLSIAAGILAFIEHPDQWRMVERDRSLIPTAVEEVLRWTSSASHSMRTAVEDVEVGGQRIKAGDRLVLWIPSANRDEAAFKSPERFDIARRPNHHLALGIGEHVCIGGTIARHQMRMLLSELLDTAERVELTGPVVPLRSLAVNGPAYCPARVVGR